MVWIWLAFLTLVLLLLALDLGVFHRKAHVVSTREALIWSAIWIACGLSFGVFVYFGYQHQWFGLGTTVDPADGSINTGSLAAAKYYAGYVVEKSLSVDNIFIIVMLFGFFAVPAIHQHRVLFWGILGALLMRGVMIAAGTAIIARFHWVLYLFGILLIVTAIKMLLSKSEHGDISQNWMIRFARKHLPVTDQYDGTHFVTRVEGKKMLTPLGMSLVAIESADLIFAVESLPAVFAITADPFLVFTSNVFAILGLRSLYFALAGVMKKFRYLKVSLSLILMLVGVKMMAMSWLKAVLGPNINFVLLGAVLLILAAGVFASLWADKRDERLRFPNAT